MIKKIKEILLTDIKNFVSIISSLVNFPIEDEFELDLYNLYFHYGLLALEQSSSFLRTNGLKILNVICYINYQPVIINFFKF
jgi:hypothetical protein